jgi:hypothetical protein
MKNKELVLQQLEQIDITIKNIEYSTNTNRKEEVIGFLGRLKNQLEQIKNLVSIEQGFFKDDQHLW